MSTKYFYLNSKTGKIYDSLRAIAKERRVDKTLVHRYLGKKRVREDAKDFSYYERITLKEVLQMASEEYRRAS